MPHRNRDHRAYGAVRHVHSFFPYYNVTDARKHSFERPFWRCAYFFETLIFQFCPFFCGQVAKCSPPQRRHESSAHPVPCAASPQLVACTRSPHARLKGGGRASCGARFHSALRLSSTNLQGAGCDSHLPAANGRGCRSGRCGPQSVGMTHEPAPENEAAGHR